MAHIRRFDMSRGWRDWLDLVLILPTILAFFVGLIAVLARDQAECSVTVRPGESVQAAIDAAEAGAVICLARGEWVENIVISKSLSLRGAGARRTTLQGAQYASPIVRITAEKGEPISVSLERLIITGEGHGVTISGASTVKIKECNITRSWYGIEAGSSVHLTLTDSTISENRIRGIVLIGSSQADIHNSHILGNMGPGVWLSDSAKARFSECEIARNSGHGLWVRDEAQVELIGCSVFGNKGHGLWLKGRSRAKVRRCEISENADQGLQVEGSAEVEVFESVLFRNWDGVRLRDRAQVRISNCTISQNKWDGIKLMGSTWATVSSSTISENGGHGLGVWDSAGAEVKANLIENNGGYGIFSWSEGEVRGEKNRMEGNGVDLGGNLSGGLRVPLREPSESEITYPDERYASLQEAIDALLPGGRLSFQAGEYEAGITLAKEVRLGTKGGRVTLKAKNEKVPVISLVRGAKLEMEGLRLSGGSEGLLIAADAQANLVNCAISGNLSGVHVSHSSQVKITDCRISENEQTGIWVGDAAQATIIGSQILENGWQGIGLGGTAQAAVIGCTVSQNRRDGGIVLWDSVQAVLEENEVSANWGYGIALYHSPCFGLFGRFTGRLSGRANISSDNSRGEVCPAELEFLLTEEGGELDWRE